MKKFNLVVVLGFLVAVSSHAQGPVKFNVGRWLENFKNSLDSKVKPETCSTEFKKRYSDLFKLNFKIVDQQALEKNGEDWAEAAFLARLYLRGYLQELEQKKQLSADCIQESRNLFRALRFLEETVAVLKYKPAAYDENKVAPYLKGEAPYLRKNPLYAEIKFPEGLKSGDLLMSRGNTSTSAMIARIGDVDGQFSHVAMVYVEPKTKKVWMMEEHIEIGSAVRPFEEYAADKNFRVVALRFHDKKLAAEAAQVMYDRLSKENVPYNFAMDASQEKELFCSQVPYVGYKKASHGEVILPSYPTKITPHNRSLLDKLGVKVTEMFAPSDLEVDFRFDVMAEWKDISRVIDNQMKDAILVQFFSWLEKYDYKLYSSAKGVAAMEAGYNVRHSWFGGLLDKKFPLNMSKDVMETVITFDFVFEKIFKKLNGINQATIDQTGYPMSFHQMYEYLEQFRKRDLRKYAEHRADVYTHPYKVFSSGKSVFHSWLHPQHMNYFQR